MNDRSRIRIGGEGSTKTEGVPRPYENAKKVGNVDPKTFGAPDQEAVSRRPLVTGNHSPMSKKGLVREECKTGNTGQGFGHIATKISS